MKMLMIVFALVLIACSNLSKVELTSDSYSLYPKEIVIDGYEGENIYFEVESNVDESLNLRFDVHLSAYVDNMDFTLRRRRETRVKPSGGFEMSIDNKSVTTSNLELGITIAQENHLVEINNINVPLNLNIRRRKKEIIELRIINKNLYYIRNGKEITMESGTIRGYIDISSTGGDVHIGTIPIHIDF